jgi:uncharacterized protein YjiS (DUF1127 family)
MLIAFIYDLVIKIESYLHKRARYLRTVDELSRLTERDLADLGIARSDIQYVARQNSFGTRL